MLVQCRKTGRWYNPHTEFYKRMNDPEILAVFRRMRLK